MAQEHVYLQSIEQHHQGSYIDGVHMEDGTYTVPSFARRLSSHQSSLRNLCWCRRIFHRTRAATSRHLTAYKPSRGQERAPLAGYVCSLQGKPLLEYHCTYLRPESQHASAFTTQVEIIKDLHFVVPR